MNKAGSSSDASKLAVIAPPHPLYGGNTDNPVVQALVTTLSELGFATLAFDWRGIGESPGQASGELGDAEEDYRTAIERALSSHTDAAGPGGQLVLAAYSFGAATALRVAASDERISGLLLVAPPPALLGPEGFSCKRPVTVIVGSNDEFAPLAQLETMVAQCPDSELEVIEGANHFFASGGLEEIPQRVRSSSALRPNSSRL